MRTTIDLPDELFRRAKSVAALRGTKFKDFVAASIEREIESPAESQQKRRTLPQMLPATGVVIPFRTNAELFEMLDAEDDEAHGRLA